MALFYACSGLRDKHNIAQYQKGFVRLSCFCTMNTPATIKGGSPTQSPQGLLEFSRVGGEGDFGGRTGNWK
jgi:hypothetical protein